MSTRLNQTGDTHFHQLLFEERKRIGEELHSRTAQSLSHALFLLNLYERNGRKEDLEEAREAIRLAIHEIRYTIAELRQEEVWPLVPSIRDFITGFRERSDVAVSFSAEGDEERVNPEIRHYVLTLVQEGLHNVLKHSGATRCDVLLHISAQKLSVSIEDNGRGFNPEEKREGTGHFGLKFMRERIEHLGGEMHVCSESGQGTRLEAFLPLP